MSKALDKIEIYGGFVDVNSTWEQTLRSSVTSLLPEVFKSETGHALNVGCERELINQKRKQCYYLEDSYQLWETGFWGIILGTLVFRVSDNLPSWIKKCEFNFSSIILKTFKRLFFFPPLVNEK